MPETRSNIVQMLHTLRAFAPIALLAWGYASEAEATNANHYGVTISSDPTQNMMFSNGVYAATADKAILNITDLENALAAGSVEVTTGNGAGGDQKGDLHVNASFTWNSRTALTLDAYHSLFVR